MRCMYCHNPDTWTIGTGTRMSPEAIMAEFLKNRVFYQNGGITVTGGEPLLQIDFLLDLFRLAKQEQVHTCIDTSGITFHPGVSEYNKKLDELMTLTDLVMLDIKHTEPEAHRTLTGHDNADIFAFAKYIDNRNVSIMIRHVLVPGITSDPVQLTKLGRFMAGLQNVKSLDVLPYHVLGVRKYKELGIEYPLAGVAAATKEEALKARNIILSAYRFYKSKTKSN